VFNKTIYEKLLDSRRFGRKLILLDKTGSTNIWIAERLDDPDIDKLTVVAENQTGGRGRFGRRWFSPPGVNLAFSLAWRAPETFKLINLVTMTAGIALAEAVADVTEAEPKLKYPNDLILAGKKAGGILAELKKTGPGSCAVIGVGVNVNTKQESFPEEIRDTATSILSACGKTVSREALLAIFMNMLEKWISTLTTRGAGPVLDRFHHFSIPFIGRRVTVTIEGETAIKGSAVGLSDIGELMIETSPGVIKTINSGETVFER